LLAAAWSLLSTRLHQNKNEVKKLNTLCEAELQEKAK